MSAPFEWQAEAWQFWLRQGQRRAHAYLFTGSAGIGLSTFVYQASQSLLCASPLENGEACGQCSACHLLTQNAHPDFFKIEVLEDKKEISIDQIRALNQKLFETSHQGGFKVAVIEQAEKMNVNAFNALLKSIEEPPENTVILLTSYQPSGLPATIKSRCQQLRFAKPRLDVATDWLQTIYPDKSPRVLKKALKVNWGAPLQAKQWLENKDDAIEASWQQQLFELLNGQLTSSKAVELWLKFPQPEVVFDYFYLWSVNHIRAALYQQKFSFKADWMHFQQTTLQAKQAWQQNANKTLVLEGLCLEWLTLNQPQSDATASFHQTFQSPLLRGQL